MTDLRILGAATHPESSPASTVSNEFVSRLMTLTRFGEYFSISSRVTLARRFGWLWRDETRIVIGHAVYSAGS